jgi:16S rRNA (cytosine967-C5)-methyltransferase
MSSPEVPGARSAALRALLAVERGVPSGHALARELPRLDDPRDRGLATELVNGVARRQGALDAELARLCRRPLDRLEPAVRAALRLGLYQLRHLDRIPAHAAVDGSVRLVRRNPGAAALVNAVLRRAATARPPVDEAATHPAWMVRRWTERLGADEARALLVANNRPAAVTLRANRLRQSGSDLLAHLRAAGVAAEPGRWLPEAVRLPHGVAPVGLPALQQGLCSVQGEASMLVAHVAAPTPGQRCLDVAAAPGGKAAHLAEWMGDVGEVVANDVSPARAERVRAAAQRLGLRAVTVRVGDARDLPAVYGATFDVVLADVPCSGLGALAARADARWRKREEDLPRLAALQGELLAAAAACLRPGGRLVYSTCTTEREENEEVVAAFLGRYPAFAVDDLRPRLPEGLRGAASADGGTVQLWPQRHGTEGFFIAALRRLA